jgi:hypothetical protein
MAAQQAGWHTTGRSLVDDRPRVGRVLHRPRQWGPRPANVPRAALYASPAGIRRRRGLEVRLRIFRWRGSRRRRNIHGHGGTRHADGRGERDQAVLVALVGVARNGDAVWDDGDVGPWLERRLVVDLAAGMEPDHNKTTRLKAPSYSHCI